MPGGTRISLDDYFAGFDESRRIFDALLAEMDALGVDDMRVTRSQVAFASGKPFAWAWIPGKYLRGKIAPLVLSVALDRRDASPRWKEVVEPTKGRLIHHLELRAPAEIDAQVRAWLQSARDLAKKPGKSGQNDSTN